MSNWEEERFGYGVAARIECDGFSLHARLFDTGFGEWSIETPGYYDAVVIYSDDFKAEQKPTLEGLKQLAVLAAREWLTKELADLAIEAPTYGP